jgi:RNA polymerase sigma-70 factor (ECF subfamily)
MEETAILAGDRGHESAPADEELALAARSDAAAFGLLYERHRLAVFRYLRARTSTEDDATELTAVTFEKALAAMPRYRESGAGFRAWLIRIARNTAIDATRRVPFLTLDDGLVSQPSATAEDAVIAKESRTQLVATINRLPPVQREAIVLRYAARMTAREIGAVLGKTEQATQKLLSRAIGAIREDYRVDR